MSDRDEVDRRLVLFDHLLTTRSPSYIAKLAGVRSVDVTGRRRRLGLPSHLEAFDRLLGTMPDEDVAKLAEVSKQVITRRRSALGIASWKDGQGDPLVAYLGELGQLSDAEIARRSGRSKSAVLKRRRKQKTAPFRSRSDSPALC